MAQRRRTIFTDEEVEEATEKSDEQSDEIMSENVDKKYFNEFVTMEIQNEIGIGEVGSRCKITLFNKTVQVSMNEYDDEWEDKDVIDCCQ